MITSSNGNLFRVTGPLWGKFTGHRWIPLTKVSHAELCCFLRSVPEQTVDYVYNRDAGDLRRHRAHYYSVTVMIKLCKRSILRMKQAFMSKQNGMNLQLRFFPAYMSVVCSALPCIIICYARRSHAPKSLRSVMAAQVKAGWMRIFQAWIVVTVS